MAKSISVTKKFLRENYYLYYMDKKLRFPFYDINNTGDYGWNFSGILFYRSYALLYGDRPIGKRLNEEQQKVIIERDLTLYSMYIKGEISIYAYKSELEKVLLKVLLK